MRIPLFLFSIGARAFISTRRSLRTATLQAGAVSESQSMTTLGNLPAKDILLSLSPNEVVASLGGLGRAKFAWNALRHGIDPREVDGTSRVPGTTDELCKLGSQGLFELDNRLNKMPIVVTHFHDFFKTILSA